MSRYRRLAERVDDALASLRGGVPLQDHVMNMIADVIIDLWDLIEDQRDALDELDGKVR